MNALSGRSADAAYQELLRCCPDIAAIHLMAYFNPPSLQQRERLGFTEQTIVGEALEAKAQTCLPFWDGVFLRALGQPEYSASLVAAAQYHQPKPEITQRMTREDVFGGAIAAAVGAAGPDRMVAVSSRVELRDGGCAHIPMLDFQHRPSVVNLRYVQAIVRDVFPGRSLILQSGASYHAICLQLVATDSLVRILARALLFGSLVDRRYIAHQLLDGQCGLRVSSGLDGKPTPLIVCEVGSGG